MTLKNRISLLERAQAASDLAFMGTLDFDEMTETPAEAMRRAPGPGSYLIMGTNVAHFGELTAAGMLTITENTAAGLVTHPEIHHGA